MMTADHQNPSRHPTENEPDAYNSVPTRNRLVLCATKAYLPVNIDGKNRCCLLDSGSQTTIVPSWIVEDYPLQQSEKLLSAASGTEIRTTGNGNRECRRPQRTHRLPMHYRNNRIHVAEKRLCETVDMERTNLICRECSAPYQSMKALRSHLRAVHRPSKTESEQPSDNKKDVASPVQRKFDAGKGDRISSQELREAALERNSIVIQDMVTKLKQMVDADTDSMDRPMSELVSTLRGVPNADRLPREIIIGIVLAARTFASTTVKNKNFIVAECLYLW